MGRPVKNNAEYFPHANGLRNHRKVKMLRNKFGNVMGYAFWCLMLEWLTEHDGLEWEYSEIEIEMFSSELGVSAAEIPPMVDYCLKIGLLAKTESEFIFSESLNENLKVVFDKRNREREKSKDRKRREDGTFIPEKPTGGGVSATVSPQSKVKYSKVKESKVEKNLNIIPETETVSGDEDIVLNLDLPPLPMPKPKPARKKKPSTAKEETVLFRNMVDYWLKDLHPGWGFRAVDGQKINSLIPRINTLLKTGGKVPTDELVLDTFKFICKNLPPFFESAELKDIDSNFNKIVTEIKNKRNGKSTASAPKSIYDQTAAVWGSR